MERYRTLSPVNEILSVEYQAGRNQSPSWYHIKQDVTSENPPFSAINQKDRADFGKLKKHKNRKHSKLQDIIIFLIFKLPQVYHAQGEEFYEVYHAGFAYSFENDLRYTASGHSINVRKFSLVLHRKV